MDNGEKSQHKKSLLGWLLSLAKFLIKLLLKAMALLWLFAKPLLDNFWQWFCKKAHLQPGIVGSSLLHIFLILFLVGGLPSLFSKKEELRYIPIEMLPVKDITNVKPKEAEKPKPEEKAEKEKKAPPKPKEKAEEKKPEPKPKDKKTPEPKKPDKKKDEVKKPDKKKEEKKKKEDEFESLLKDLEKMKSEKQEKQTPQDYDPNQPLSVSEIDAIIGQISKNWVIPAGAIDAENLVVTLRIELARDGTVRNVEVVDTYKYNSDVVYRAAAESALRAVYKSSPLKNLPVDKYSIWKDMKINFNPKELF